MTIAIHIRAGVATFFDNFFEEFAARDILYYDENFASACQDLFHLHHVRMFQLFHNRYFLLDLLAHILVLNLLLIQDFDSYHFLRLDVACQFDFAKCTLSEGFDDFIPSTKTHSYFG